MNKKKVVLLLLAVLIFGAGYVALKFLGPATKKQGDGYLYIKTGATYEDVKRELTGNKILNSTSWFDRAARLIGYTKVKPGRYKVPAGISVTNLVRLLNNGQQTPVNLVITKLRTKESLASKIGAQFECDSLEVIAFLNNNDSLKAFDLDSNTAMAAVMPYNYDIKWNTTPARIFGQFHKAYTDFWTDTRKQKASAHGLSPMQVMTIASIVEEETRDKNDKPNIASVYINRYKKNMLLQADPTVKFALKDFGIRRILFGHLKVVSPYNTYQNKGLPPGPICTPSLESIEAVLDAPQTEYIYFVANSNFDGTHIFTTNYEDHMKYAKLFQEELTRRQAKKAAE